MRLKTKHTAAVTNGISPYSRKPLHSCSGRKTVLQKPKINGSAENMRITIDKENESFRYVFIPERFVKLLASLIRRTPLKINIPPIAILTNVNTIPPKTANRPMKYAMKYTIKYCVSPSASIDAFHICTVKIKPNTK